MPASATARLGWLACLLGFLSSAAADVGPFPRGTGSSLAPPGDLPGVGVRLAEEEITLDLRGTAGDPYGHQKLIVGVLFRFDNPGPEDARIEVGFPVGPSRSMEDFVARVGDQTRTLRLWDRMGRREWTMNPTSKQRMEEIREAQKREPDLWYLWDEVFPAGKRVEIVVSYSATIATRMYSSRQTGYLLHTGAGWNGPIGRVRATLRVSGTLTTDNLLGVLPRDGLSRTPDGLLAWDRHEVEPTVADDIRIRYDSIMSYDQRVTDWRPRAGQDWGVAVRFAEVLSGAGTRQGRDLTEAEGADLLDAVARFLGPPVRTGEQLVLDSANPDPQGRKPRYVGHVGAYLEPALRLTVEACGLLPGNPRALELLGKAVEAHDACLAGRLTYAGEVQTLTGYDREEHEAAIAHSLAAARALLPRK